MKILKASDLSVCELSYGSWKRNTEGPAEHKTAGKIPVDEYIRTEMEKVYRGMRKRMLT